MAGWVLGGAIPGYYPATKGGPRTSEAGPVRPAGPGVGGFWGRNTHVRGRRRGRSCTTLRARSVAPGALPVQDLADCRLTANKGEISVIFLKT